MECTFRLPSGGTLGEMIIFTLAQEWPLSGKSLYLRAQRSYFQAVSYQAVHKAAGELVEQGVLAKEGMLYRLNVEWLEQLILFGFETKKAYAKERRFGGFG